MITEQKLQGISICRQGPDHYKFGDPFDTMFVVIGDEIIGMVGKPNMGEIRRHFQGRRMRWVRIKGGNKQDRTGTGYVTKRIT